MPKYPLSDVLDPEKALATGLRTGVPTILKGESLIALKAISSAIVDEFQPISATEWMWTNVLAYSYFRLHRVWFIANQVAEREQSHGVLFHSVEMDALRPVLESTIQSITSDIYTLEDTFRRVSAQGSGVPDLAIKNVSLHIMGRDYCNDPSELHKALSEALEHFDDESPKKSLKEVTEFILEAMRGTIAENRQSVIEIERIRARLSSTSIATMSIHRDSDRLLSQELKLIGNIEKATSNLARLAKMRGA
jgi:hypothetical protein